jgi:hypothetical protein
MMSLSRLVLSKLLLARRGLPLLPVQQVRFHWYQDEVRPIRDPVTGKWRYEEPHFTLQRFDTGKTGTNDEMCACILCSN